MKIKTQTIHTVDYNDFESAVNEFFGMEDYSFVASEEASNYSSYDYTCTGEGADSYEAKRLTDWLCGDTYQPPSPTTLLNRMAAEGAIPTGEYLIKVSW